MPPQLNIKKQIAESGDGIYVNRWWTGLITNRSPLFVPVSSLGLQVLARHDALLDGQNVEISPTSTVKRRAGFPRFCSTQLGAETPLTFASFKNTNGVIKNLIDTDLRVASFTASAIVSLFTKGTTAQTSFQKVGDTLYMCDGTNLKKWDGTTVTGWGIASPITAPTVGFVTGTLSPTAGYRWVYVYKDSSNGHVSTASPVSAFTGPQTLKNFTIGGSYSTDTRVDKVSIYRIKDGGALYNFVTDIANNSAGGSWSFTDSTTDANLNDFILAPTSHVNDPPPAGASLVTFHMGRMWVAVGNKLYFGGGPQITNGVPEEAFPPANVFKLPGKITAMVSTTNGLAVWTTDDWFFVLGTDIGNFYVVKYQSNFGVANQNCVVQDGDLVFIFTQRKQLFSFSDSLNEVGYPIRDQLALFDPTVSYMALHRSGVDEGLFISNGSTTVFRFSLVANVWCPKATVVGGVKAIASIEVASSDFRLMTGRAAQNGFILARDTGSTFADDGSTYSGFATVGTIILAPPGQNASISSLMLEVMPVGTYPTLAILANEVSGSFITLPNPVNEPPMLPSSTTITTKRHYLKAAATPIPSQMRFLQMKFTFAQEAAANEVLGLAIGT
jgi:hypothetical protein